MVNEFSSSYGVNFWVRCASGNVLWPLWHFWNCFATFWVTLVIVYAIFLNFDFVAKLGFCNRGHRVMEYKKSVLFCCKLSIFNWRIIQLKLIHINSFWSISQIIHPSIICNPIQNNYVLLYSDFIKGAGIAGGSPVVCSWIPRLVSHVIVKFNHNSYWDSQTSRTHICPE